MARRLKRAAEIIPEISYRPGVIDPDVESAMISLFTPASKPPEQPGAGRALSPAPVETSQPIENKIPIETPPVPNPKVTPGGMLDVHSVGLIGSPTVGVLNTPPRAVIDIPPVAIPIKPTVPDSESHAGGAIVSPTSPASDSHPVGISSVRTVPPAVPAILSDSPPVGITKMAPGGASESVPVGLSKTPPVEKLTPPEVLDIRHVKLRPVRNIQDGLTPGEFLLLTEMFKLAAPLMSSKDRILLRAGYRTLSERTGQDPKTVKRNRRGLTKKFCIEVAGQNTFTEAAQFRVLHFDTILARWRAAGLVWVRRAGRTVDLTSASSVGDSTMPPGGVFGKPTVYTTLPRTVYEQETPIGEAPPQAEGKTPIGSVGVSPAYLSSSSTDNKSSTEAPPLVAAAIIREFGFVDDDALQTLIRKCRQNAPDATDEEIAELGALTARRISKMRGIDNPVGLLITQTANCFSGEPFAMYRREKAGQARRLAELYDGEN